MRMTTTINGQASVKPQSVTRYEIVSDEEGAFEPCGCMTSSKGEAMKELRSVRRYCPDAYVAKVTYTRATVRSHRKDGGR